MTRASWPPSCGCERAIWPAPTSTRPTAQERRQAVRWPWHRSRWPARRNDGRRGTARYEGTTRAGACHVARGRCGSSGARRIDRKERGGTSGFRPFRAPIDATQAHEYLGPASRWFRGRQPQESSPCPITSRPSPNAAIGQRNLGATSASSTSARRTPD